MDPKLQGKHRIPTVCLLLGHDVSVLMHVSLLHQLASIQLQIGSVS